MKADRSSPRKRRAPRLPAPAPPPAADPASVAEAALRAALEGRPRPTAMPAPLFERRRQRAQQRLQEALEGRGSAEVPEAIRVEVEGLARRWAERALEDGFADVETFELRCFQEGELAQASRSGNKAARWAALEQQHRAAILKEYGRIELRGLQMSARVYQDLEVAYVPLRLEDTSSPGEVHRLDKGVEIQTIPRLTAPELLGKHERVLIIGAPGSGKSTLLAYLASRSAAGRLHEEAGWPESPVPFLVPVRSLDSTDLDERALAAARPECDVAFVRRVLGARRALVLIDGLDEAREGASALLPALEAFAKEHPGNRIVVTTRPAPALGSERLEVPGFATATLVSMTREEVLDFIDRWCLAAETSIQKDTSRARADAKQAAEDLKARVQQSRPVARLAQTPLICSVLCIVHRFLGQRIPERRTALYEASTNVLLYEWDRAKFPEGALIGQLDAQAKRYLLSGLAVWMHKKHLAEAPAEIVVERFAERLPALGHSADEATRILGEIQHRSGILVERRPGLYAFSHLTFQEFLTAAEFVRLGRIAGLARHYADRWWHEVIALAAGFPGANAPGLIRALLRPKKDGPLRTVLAAHCLETAVDAPMSVRLEVDERLKNLVPPRSDKAVDMVVGLGPVAGLVLLRALESTDPAGRARAALALGRIGYEPACNALGRLLTDRTTVEEGVTCNVDRLEFLFTSHHTIASFAAIALLNLFASPSDLARISLQQVHRVASEETLELLKFFCRSDIRNLLNPRQRELLDQIEPAITAALLGASRSKRAARSG